MLSANVEPISLRVDEITDLIGDHYGELSEHKGKRIPLDPDFEQYLLRDAAGEIIFVGLRSDGDLVGYLIAFVSSALHYKSCLTSICDIFFVHRGYRGDSGGALLFFAWEAECKRRGVKLMSAGIKARHQERAAPLLEGLGFMPTEIMYWKFNE